MSLVKYRKKRNFKLTNEPYGRVKSTKTSLYIIQKHAASHLHYDLRLELNGVLKSWAIPKGPSLDHSIKRLAVEVEDHPIEYSTFEGVIPSYEYGGGIVMLWDTGSWECEQPNPNIAYKKGNLSFILKGKRLKGRWHLIRFRSNSKNWLFIKANDKYAKSEEEFNITEKRTKSVASRLSLNEINAYINKPKNNKIKAQHSLKKNQASLNKSVKKTVKVAMPTVIHPELATLVSTPPYGDKWCHEIKYDGYRIVAFIKAKKIRLITRNRKDWTIKFSYLADALRHLPVKSAILDGELVALDKNHRPNFQLLQNLIGKKESFRLVYYIFDLLYYNGNDLMQHPLLKRKQQLKKIIPKASSILRYSDHLIGEGNLLFKKTCKFAMEGIISKKIDSSYTQKRSRNWLKIKCRKRQEFIVIGFTTPSDRQNYFGALLLGVFSKHKHLQYCGKVGTGFSGDTSSDMYKYLNRFKTDKIQVDIKSTGINQVTWIRPHVVIEVEFTEWTKKGVLRHPSFKGIRYDKKAKEVIHENSEPKAKESQTQT